MSSEAPVKAPPSPSPDPRKKSRWRRRLLSFSILLLIGVWFAPSIIAKTGLRNRIVNDAAAGLRGAVEIGGASLGWFSPVELRDVVVKDAEGRTLLAVPRATSSKSLLALLRDRSNLGEFNLVSPTVELVCAKGTTNLEEAIAEFLKEDGSEPSPTRPAVVLRVASGKLHVTHPESGRDWRFEQIEATVGIPASRSEPVAVKVALVESSSSPGKLAADLAIGDHGTADLVASDFPLDTLMPVLERVAPGTIVAGRLTANLKGEWHQKPDSPLTATLEGRASARDLDLTAPWLNGDRLKLASAELPLKIETAGSGLRIDRADLTCDIGTVSAAGTFDPAEPLDRMVDRPGVRLEADVDLAKLAALLPNLLRIREGTSIREGKLNLKLASRATDAGTAWDGEVRTSALKAERDGKPIEWAEPLAIEFSGRVPPGHLPTFDKFICRSDFIAINAQGSRESFRAAANVYLDRLTEHLGEFVDLGHARLSGEASAWVVAARTPQGAFKSSAGIDLKEFEFRTGKTGGLAEPALALRARAEGQWPGGGPVRIDSGTFSVAAGVDRLELSLKEPVPDIRSLDRAKCAVHLAGDLGRWMNRVRSFVRVPAHYVFGGTVTANGTLRLEPKALAIDALNLTIDQAKFRGAGLNIDEPRMTATADMTLDRGTGSTTFSKFHITSPVLNVTDGTLAFEIPRDGNLAVSGKGNAVVDLNRAGRTLKLQKDPRGSDAFHGRGTGPFQFRWQGGTTTFGGTQDIANFAYGLPEQPDISEKSMKLDLDGRYDDKPDRFTLNRGRIERTGLAVEAKGVWSNFDTTQDVALSGTVAYDLAALTPELRESLGGDFQAAGRGSRPFSLAGSLAPRGAPKSASPFAHLAADFGLGWDFIRAHGFDIGKSDLTAKLAKGVAAISPVRANFGGGQIIVAPTIRLEPAPGEVSFAKGKIVDRAKLTPAATAGALGYALPAIANAAQAEGDISVVLDDNRIPLADFSKATLKGQIIVHQAKVGAGPVVAEIVKLLGQPPASMTLANEMTVPVRVENGRVPHENFALTVNGYTVKTSGSVGFDGTLALVADVPIPGTFPGLKNNPTVKKALEGKIVKVPITGTMSKPAIDPRLFQAAVANLARDAAKGIGRAVIEKELEKVFPGGLPIPKKAMPFFPKR